MLAGLRRLGVNLLFAVGGDGTLRGAHAISEEAVRRGEQIAVVGVPKTIDNDVSFVQKTFGFETARHIGVELARSLHEDAKTTTRWYLIVSMGRAAGHLALGIGKASAATVTIISEEFRGRAVGLDEICDIIIGSVVKRMALAGGRAVVQAAEEASEQVALGGGVPVSTGFAPVVVGAGAG